MNNYKIVNNKLLSLEYKICLFFIVIGIVLLPFSDTKLGEHVPGILRIFLSYESSLSMYFFLAFIFSFAGIMVYVLPLLVTSIPTGILTGLVAIEILKRVKKEQFQ